MIPDTCDRVILLSGGRIAADGPADTILRDRALSEANRMELPLSLAKRERFGRVLTAASVCSL